MTLGRMPSCASGDTSPASWTGPSAANSGEKKLKTEGARYTACPIFEIRLSLSSTSRWSRAPYSRPRRRW